MVSLWSLAVIAFERWLVVCKPLGNFVFKPNHAIACCALTWVCALIAAVPPLVGWSRSVITTYNSHICFSIVGIVIRLYLQFSTTELIQNIHTNTTQALTIYLFYVFIGTSQRACSAPVGRIGTQLVPNITLSPM